MSAKKMNWSEALQPLLKKYQGKPHPLEAKNTYQLVVMVILSAQSSDRQINKLAPELFKDFPDMKALAAALPSDLYPHIDDVRGFQKKAEWLVGIAKELKEDKNIPMTMEGLTALK